VFVGSRANYTSIKMVMRALKQHPELELVTVVGASALLSRYGKVIDYIRHDGFEIDHFFHMIVEGETPATMAKSTGLGLIEMATILENAKPDFLVVVGDRFEIAAVALAGAYMNIPIAHTMGGEVTGTIDESVRHAVTKLSHVHFAANEESAERIIRMGERKESVFTVGCPRIDLVSEILTDGGPLTRDDFLGYRGLGTNVDWNKPFLLVQQHPVTTEYGSGRKQIEETLAALEQLQMPTIMLWPNVDAGSEDLAKGIRTFRENRAPEWLELYINLPHEAYIKLMARTACIIGNSSSAIREGPFIGTPAVNVGSRQDHRQRGRNVLDVPHDRDAITDGVRQQLRHGSYASEPVYGDGNASGRIVECLSSIEVDIQKWLAY
jgi:UDP-hydrolysing UDP-N-acetyl-D-glucosamine 2-epimerase